MARKPVLLNSIGISLVARFERLGELSDLKDAISMLRNAVGFTPHGHPEKADRLRRVATLISFMTTPQTNTAQLVVLCFWLVASITSTHPASSLVKNDMGDYRDSVH
ncbi:hypothetical protein L210DRAFT_3763761 [Boletus edulis BED1]|uniref:Uncharacterized protein n=1 Tax=Boletus edulis BED1 TaxID=1328754 RepID=A0AAD4G9U5_BOLED|nr:hypothetical protein L210DRAFT_3763761 [Boletus edulis BED1]